MKSRYPPDVAGLQAYVTDLFDRYKKKRTEIKLRDRHVANKLRIDLAALPGIQDALNLGDVLSCKRGLTRSVYKIKL